MASSVLGIVPLPDSRWDLSSCWDRVLRCAGISNPRMLFTNDADLKRAREIIDSYRNGQLKDTTPEFWSAKKQLDATVHPDTGEKVLLPFRMSSCVLSNLVVTQLLRYAILYIPSITTYMLSSNYCRVSVSTRARPHTAESFNM